jgi:hypothetical protein
MLESALPPVLLGLELPAVPPLSALPAPLVVPLPLPLLLLGSAPSAAPADPPLLRWGPA